MHCAHRTASICGQNGSAGPRLYEAVAGRPSAQRKYNQTVSMDVASASPPVLGSVGAPVVAAVAGSPGELQIEACWEHSLLLPGNVLCPAPQEAPARRQWAASPSASPRPHRRSTGQTRGRQAWAVRSEPPGASQVGAPLRLGAPASGMGSWGPELIIPGLGCVLWLSCRAKLSFAHWTVVRPSVGS